MSGKQKKVPLIKVGGGQNKYLFRRNNTFWVRFRKSGKRPLERSLGTEFLTEARILRDKLIAEHMGTKARFESKVLLVDDKFPEFLELKKVKSAATYASMKNQWENHLKEYFANMYLDEVSESEWLRYVAKKRKTHPARKFFNDRKYLSMFLGWLHRDGLIQKIPKLPNVDPEIAEGKVFSNDQILRLLVYASKDLKIQILCAVTMGMRIGEIMSLEWEQIDFEKKTIYLPAAKTKIRRERRFGISATCLSLLKARREQSDGGAVFPSPRNRNVCQGRDGHKKAWATAKRYAGVPGEFRFHWLRHTFLTRAFKMSTNAALICEYAGLSLDEAQKTYLHFTVEDTRIVSTLVEVKI